MQLDRVPPRFLFPQLPGTATDPVGVENESEFRFAHVPAELPFVEPAAKAVPRRALGWVHRVALALTCFSLLGQGEPARVDWRFRSPSALIATYWEALWANDVETLRQCFVDPANATPEPGALYFLPPSQRICVYPIRSLSSEEGRVVASYEVRFRPDGATVEMHFVASTSLVRVRNGWRIAGNPEDVGIPEWRPIPRRFGV